MVSGLRGEESIAALCRRDGIAEGLYYSWSKQFLEAGKKRLAGDTGRQATSGEVKGLRQEMRDLKELVAELSLENRLQKKACSPMGETRNEVSCIREVGDHPAGGEVTRAFCIAGFANYGADLSGAVSRLCFLLVQNGQGRVAGFGNLVAQADLL